MDNKVSSANSGALWEFNINTQSGSSVGYLSLKFEFHQLSTIQVLLLHNFLDIFHIKNSI